ncbi:MAG: hypothetical protein LBC44_00540 [Mycoplasmataceae bacterium]|nr:hypothetical protein [Mycoplasmataceae bacterium]
MLNKNNWLELEWNEPLTDKENEWFQSWIEFGKIVKIDGKYFVDSNDPIWAYLMNIVVRIQDKPELVKKVKHIEMYIDNEPEEIIEYWKEKGIL